MPLPRLVRACVRVRVRVRACVRACVRARVCEAYIDDKIRMEHSVLLTIY